MYDEIDIFLDEDELVHYGMPRRSGRYPWGSGDNPYQHEDYFGSVSKNLKSKGLSENDILTVFGLSKEEYRALTFEDFYNTRMKLKDRGFSDDEIRESLEMSSTDYRAMNQISKAAKREEEFRIIRELADKGYSNAEIGKRLDPPRGESSIRAMRDEAFQLRNKYTSNTADMLRNEVDSKGFIDIGKGVEVECGVSKERFNTAVTMLELQGYEVYSIDLEQVTNKGRYTKLKVLCPPGTEYKELLNNPDKIKTITSYMEDGGEKIRAVQFPTSLDSSRIQIRYNEDGGIEKDGVIELRRNVDDLSLGKSLYAQVRIAVDGTHYLKGMAVYSDDLPDGVDVVFNTNKHKGTPMKDVLKELKTNKDGTINEENPFGALIKAGGQSTYIDSDGNEKLSPINKLREEGDWSEYSKTLSSQFLSKQSDGLIKRQLGLAYAEKAEEYDEICNLTNPAVKKKLLESFADDCDASAVHLKAAALPRQQTQVLIPVTSLKDTEVFAPNYQPGENVVLIRYPHAGTFEIPELTVNNRNKEALSVLGKNSKDAIGINSKVAGRLSGADFDGDTVLVIPVNDKVRVRTSAPLKALVDFDPKESYPYHEGMKAMKKGSVGNEMGKISNLITDMTLQGATTDELARAVRHSMVVIDAYKHKLDYRQSEIDNGIAELKNKYQPDGGASTLISRSKSPKYVDKRRMFQIDKDTDPETGEKIYREADPYTTKNGEIKYYRQTSSKMAETNDARTLISDANTRAEIEYASYANKLKALGNEARKEYLSTKGITRNSTATETYKEEVESLKGKLDLALMNAPKERQAQIAASTIVNIQMRDNPDNYSEKGEEKKLRQQALTNARAQLGASKRNVQIDITPKEWEAIQAGAVSNNMLKDILDNTDMDKVKQYAMPRTNTISPAKVAHIKALKASGNTNADIAEITGLSVSTVLKYIE